MLVILYRREITQVYTYNRGDNTGGEGVPFALIQHCKGNNSV